MLAGQYKTHKVPWHALFPVTLTQPLRPREILFKIASKVCMEAMDFYILVKVILLSTLHTPHRHLPYVVLGSGGGGGEHVLFILR